MLMGNGKRWLVAVGVFSAFLDESGTGDKSPIVTVAGFFSSFSSAELDGDSGVTPSHQTK
jgi:hypothetical protein